MGGNVFSQDAIRIAIANSQPALVLDLAPLGYPAAKLRFQIAPFAHPAYSNCLMGQQHRVKAKRRRRKAYLERKRTAAKAPRRSAKPRGKKASEETPS